ncbi:MAG: GUN4 domain-containing protein [Xenococcaceae cyanobacterium]
MNDKKKEPYSRDFMMPLRSAANINYTCLRDLLVAKSWFDAYQQTKLIMRTVAKETSFIDPRGVLYIDNIMRFPCLDLRTIDQLWTNYSEGKFGFSIQKDIYQSLGGTDQFNIQVWKAFCQRVGWDLLAIDSNLIFSIDAPPGHLPSVFNVDLVAFDSYDSFYSSLYTGECITGKSLIAEFFRMVNVCLNPTSQDDQASL